MPEGTGWKTVVEWGQGAAGVQGVRRSSEEACLAPPLPSQHTRTHRAISPWRLRHAC